MSAPQFRTAVPKRRYKLGDYDVTILADIESTDDHAYVYILAMMAMGDSQPVLFLTVEIAPKASRDDGRYLLAARTADEVRTLGQSDNWQDVDVFARDVLPVAGKLLGVAANVEAMRLL